MGFLRAFSIVGLQYTMYDKLQIFHAYIEPEQVWNNECIELYRNEEEKGQQGRQIWLPREKCGELGRVENLIFVVTTIFNALAYTHLKKTSIYRMYNLKQIGNKEFIMWATTFVFIAV